MRFSKKLFNPNYIYNKRHRVLSCLKRAFYSLQRDIALSNVYINKNDRKFMSLKNIHMQKRCFIIGNGPSLTITDLQRIHDLHEISFAFNKIYLAFNGTNFRPSYYVVEDILMVDSVKAQIPKLDSFRKFFPYDHRSAFCGASNALYYYWDLGLFLPPTPEFSPYPFHIRCGGTVTYTALQLAVFFGCNPIYLIGCDFSFAVPQKKLQNDDEVVISEGEKNHFHPDYRQKGEKWCAPKLDLQLAAFQSARQYAEQHGIQIYNATRGGLLEVFERKDLDELLCA